MKRAPRLDELDDPADAVSTTMERVERVTAPPPFEPSVFAQEVEEASERTTQPPVPAFEMLRDSCKMALEEDADAALSPEVTLSADAPSHVKIKAPRPAPRT